jgi:hypothetical protein
MSDRPTLEIFAAALRDAGYTVIPPRRHAPDFARLIRDAEAKLPPHMPGGGLGGAGGGRFG